MEAFHRLVHSFQTGDLGTTIVTWTLQSQDNGTLLTLEHRGFVGTQDVITSFILHFGW